LTGQLNGSRPVRLDVVVKSFALSSAVQRILIGGGRGMVADANVVDARTGAVIVAYPELRAGQGIVGTAVQAAIDNASEQSVAEKLAVRYGELYRRWLLHQAEPPDMSAPATASPLQSGCGLCLKRRGSADPTGV
jgi:hypothetical protein